MLILRIVLRIVGDWLIFNFHTYSNWGKQKPARSSEFIELPNFTPDDVIRPINLPTTTKSDIEIILEQKNREA